MSRFVLWHRHQAHECPVAFAAWKGFDSPLRHTVAMASCAVGDHSVYWTVQAAGPEQARALMPEYVAERTEVIEVREITTP